VQDDSEGPGGEVRPRLIGRCAADYTVAFERFGSARPVAERGMSNDPDHTERSEAAVSWSALA
jgi:hypothetical protein